MKRKSFLLIATAIVLQLNGISQSNPLVKYLPDNVGLVMSIDIKKLGGKIPLETFRQSFIYQQMMKDQNSPLPKIFNDPSSMGIDLSTGILIALKTQSADRYERNQPVFHLFIKLSNAETFTKQIQGMFDKSDNDANQIQTYGTDRISISQGRMAAGWNNDVLVITSGYSDEMIKELAAYHSYEPDTMAMADTTARFDYKGMEERMKKGQRDLCFQLLTPKPQNIFSTNNYFMEAMNSEADIRMWNGGAMNPIAKQFGPLSGILEKLEAFSGKNKIGLVNFENGRIVTKSRNFIEGPVADIYKKYPSNPQNTDLIRRLPAGTILGLVNTSFNQAMSNEMMEKSGIMELLDSLKKKIPFDLSLLRNTFKSNAMIAVIKTNKPVDDMDKMKGLEIIFALPVADKTQFEKLKTAVMPLWDSLNRKIEKPKDELLEYKKTSLPKFFAKYNDGLLVLSSSAEAANNFLNNSGTGSVPEWIQSYTNYPMVATIDFGQIIKAVSSMDKEAPAKGMTSILINLFDRILMYGGNYENGSINSTMEFRFANRTDNALKQLFELFNTMMDSKRSAMGDNKDGAWIDGMPRDSVMTHESIVVPKFKSAIVQEFANEYAAYVTEYVASSRNGDTARANALNRQAEIFGSKGEALGKELSKDAEESQKFAEWITVVSRQLTNTTQQVTIEDIKQEKNEQEPPPPPPVKPKKTKVETKKYTPPVKKKN